ncbi:histidine kinase [Alteromonas portus]|uniref:Histidine kinase n=1 Tax=Alteromonas portus TaxID=2565549 RepID=A0A4U0ZJH1_9ALTE|nr:histidine kinase [Alteromonas portus]TKB03200.1 histidine kinase [Alteromonas portus]
MRSHNSMQNNVDAVPARHLDEGTANVGESTNHVDDKDATQVMPLLGSGRKKRWSHGSLFFSLFFFVPLIISRPLPVEIWVLQTLGYLSFVTLYVKAISQPVKALPSYLLFMFLLSVGCSFQNPGGATIIGFIAFIVGYYNSVKTGLASISAMIIVLLTLNITMFESAHFLLAASIINSLVLFGFGVMERKETLHALKENQQAEALRVLSAIAERERIGRDLHDVAGHALSSISLKAQLADKLISKDKIEDAHREVKALAQLSQALLSDIRQAVSDIKQLSLSDEIAKDKSLLEENGFNVTTRIDGSAEQRLNTKQERQLALILKELTTNTLRYSKGSAVSLDLEVNSTTIKMTYKDDGVVENGASIKEGNGLMGIRERVASIYAEVDISFLPHPIVSIQLNVEQASSLKASV